jgi:hypothetical protein
MTIEQLLLFGATTVGGWLLRHYGWFVGVQPATTTRKTTGVTPATQAVAPSIKAEIDGIVKEAVQLAMAAALAELRAATGPVPVK